MSEIRVIRFYSVSAPHGEFSNFASYPIHLDGRMWKTSEHYFQAMKFVDPARRESVRRAKTPAIAARMGRDRRHPIRRDWESVKLDVMRRAVHAKFDQHPELAALLVATGSATLVEHADRDTFWADGGDGRGQNWLGRILMETRTGLVARGVEV